MIGFQVRSHHTRVGRRPSTDGGFSLIELLVAFAMLGLAFGILLPTLGDNASRTTRIVAEAEAVLLARSIVDRVGTDIPLRDGSVVEETNAGDDVSWRMEIRRFRDEAGSADWPVAAFRVTVSVTHSHGLADVTLATLRLGEDDRQ